MPRLADTPRPVWLLFAAAVGGVALWLGGASTTEDAPGRPEPMVTRPTGLIRSPGAAEAPSGDYDAALSELERAAVAHQQALVRCRSPMLGEGVGRGAIVVRVPPAGEQEFCHDCPIIHQTALMMVPVGPTEGFMRVPKGDELALTWPPTQAGGTVDCTSIERVGRSVMLSGEASFASGDAAPNALVRCGRSVTWTDVRGRFVLESWLNLGGRGLRAARRLSERSAPRVLGVHPGLLAERPPGARPDLGRVSRVDCARRGQRRGGLRARGALEGVLAGGDAPSLARGGHREGPADPESPHTLHRLSPPRGGGRGRARAQPYAAPLHTASLSHTPPRGSP